MHEERGTSSTSQAPFRVIAVCVAIILGFLRISCMQDSSESR